MLTSNITKKGWRFIIQSFGTICLEALFQGKTIKRHACWLPTPNFKHWNVFSRLIQHHGPFWQTSLSPFAQLKKLLMSTTSPSTWRNLENSFPGSWWKCLMVKPSWRLVDPGTYRKSTVEEASGIFWKSGLRYLIWSKLTSTTPGRNFGHPGAFFSILRHVAKFDAWINSGKSRVDERRWVALKWNHLFKSTWGSKMGQTKWNTPLKTNMSQKNGLF